MGGSPDRRAAAETLLLRLRRGPAASPEHARAKYDEIAATEKPNFPEGERSVSDMFPDMREAARLQNAAPQGEQSQHNEEIAAGLHTPSSGTVGDNPARGEDELGDNLHDRGP